MRGLRLEEARHQVLRRQEATQEEVQLPEEDRLRGRDVRGVPRRRRGRRGQDQDQDQLSVVSVCQREDRTGSDDGCIWNLYLFCNFFQSVIFI